MIFYFIFLLLCTGAISQASLSGYPGHAAAPHDLLFSLTASNTWREFKAPLAQHTANKPHEKQILISEIKLKSNDTTFIEGLTARWHGATVGRMVASLYSKKLTDHKAPVPIDANLICDGTWNAKTKEFVFPVNKKLVASDTYYLMLHVPKKFEAKLKMGSLEIAQQEKPRLLGYKGRSQIGARNDKKKALHKP